MGEAPKVVSIRGGEVRPAHEPRPDVIKALEKALEMARAGEIVGFAAAFVHGDDRTSGAQHGRSGRASVGMLQILIADIVDDERSQR